LIAQCRLLAVALCLVALRVSAACPPQDFTPPRSVRIDGEAVLLVVHASAGFDPRYATKHGTDQAIALARSRRMPVIYLQDDSPGRDYFADDCEPDYRVRSQGGELGFDLSRVSRLYVVGGHLEMCLSTAINEVLLQWAKQPPRNRTVTYFMDAIYSNGKMIDPSDPFYKDFDRFMGIVGHGRPAGEQWPKLTLLETMGVIIREEHEIDYLKQILPRWDRTFPKSHRIDLTLNGGSPHLLRTAEGKRAATITFRFLDSAINLQPPNCSSPDVGAGCDR